MMMMMMPLLAPVRNLSNLSSRWIHQIKRVCDDDKSLQVQWGCSSLIQGWIEIWQVTQSCCMKWFSSLKDELNYNRPWWNSTKVYICFNSGMHGIIWSGMTGGMIQPGWDGELARHVEKPSEAGSGHPPRTGTAEMKDCLVLEQQHQTTASSCMLSPIPHSPSLTLETLTTIWYSSAGARLPGCHGYPMPEVSQRDNPRRHSQITWILFASHLCVLRSNLIYLFPCRAIQCEYK